jgi:hypothetical protein
MFSTHRGLVPVRVQLASITLLAADCVATALSLLSRAREQAVGEPTKKGL